MTLAFLACVEAGNLENQGLLLFRSIRRYGGRFADAAIHSFQPREGPALRPDTYEAFEDLRVCHHVEVLNDRYTHYPISNKVFVCAWAEAHLAEDVLVFCDSDTFFAGEPDAFDLDARTAVAVRPVASRNRGSSGPECPEDVYWQRLYEICGVTTEPFIETAVSRERIRAYWNSGLVVARRSQGLFAQWQRDFVQLMEARHVPPDGKLTFMDQLAFAATLAREPSRVQTLDAPYNYYLPKRPIMHPPERDYQFSDLVHVHYHAWFNKPGFLETLRPPLDRESEVYRWLERFLPFEPTIDKPPNF